MADNLQSDTATKAPAKSITESITTGIQAGLAEVPTPTEAAKTTYSKVKEGASGLATEAGTVVHKAASQGKDKASEALDTFAKLAEDAAEEVEKRFGPTYGEYARKAASTVSGFATTVQNKSVDTMIDDTKSFVRKSPMAAVSVAATLGFILTRLIKVGTSNETTSSDSTSDRNSESYRSGMSGSGTTDRGSDPYRSNTPGDLNR